MGSSTKVEAPQPSAQENYLLQQILDQLTEQQAYNDMMLPEYAHQLHYRIDEVAATPYEFTEAEQGTIDAYTKAKSDVEYWSNKIKEYGGGAPTSILIHYNNAKKRYDKVAGQYDLLQQKAETYEGKTTQQWVKMSDEEWYNSEKTTDAERRNWDIATETGERQLKALRGELPLTESLQQQKQTEFEQMKATYGITGDSVDTATASDTIGTQNLSEFKKRWNALEEQERYGQLSSGTSQNIQATGLASDIANRNIGSLAGLGGANAGVTSGYYSLLQPYMAYTQAGYQAQAQNQLTAAQRQASLYGLAGMGIGGLIGGYFGGPAGASAGMGVGGRAGGYAASSKKFKTDIKTKTKKDEDKALKDIVGTRSVEYKYKKAMGLGSKKHLGAIAEESPKGIVNKDKTAINIADKLELVSMAVKSLDRKVQKLAEA